MGFLTKLFGGEEELPDDVKQWLEDIRKLMRSKQVNEAMSRLRHLESEYPKSAEIQFLLGRGSLLMRDVGAAIATLQKAVKLDPKMYDAWYELGNAYNDNKETDKAIDAFKRELELMPNPERAVAVSRLIKEYEREENAAEFLENSLNRASSSKIAKGFTPSSRASAYFELGSLFQELHKNKEAVKYLKKAVEAHPRHAEAHFRLGQTMQRMGEATEGMEHIKQAARLGHRESQSKLMKHRIEWR